MNLGGVRHGIACGALRGRSRHICIALPKHAVTLKTIHARMLRKKKQKKIKKGRKTHEYDRRGEIRES